MLRNRCLRLWVARTSMGLLVLVLARALAACEIDSDTPAAPTTGFAGAAPVAAPPPGGPSSVGPGVVFPGNPRPALPFSTEFSGPVARMKDGPPPISGGTLLAASGGKLVAADPDRDAIYIVDVATQALDHRVELMPGDEPGRVVQDAQGRVHVVLRGGKGIASFTLSQAAKVQRSPVCDLPRGITYDAARDHLYVACAEGALVQVDPATGARERKIELGRDLRDVAVHGDEIFVTRFRSAELIRLSAESGVLADVRVPPTTRAFDFATRDALQPLPPDTAPPLKPDATPSVAWRMIDIPGRGVALLHQRAQLGPVFISAAGYETPVTSCRRGVVGGAITIDDQPSMGTTLDIAMQGLHVDLAVNPSGTRVAVANPGVWGARAGLQVYLLPARSTVSGDLTQLPGALCLSPENEPPNSGQITAVAFVSDELVVAQQREPAGIVFYSLVPPTRNTLLVLKEESRRDTGHSLFHISAGSGVACASCHPEAGDDGRVWNFDVVGARRTQNLRGGMLGSEPFQWNGDFRNFDSVVDEIFVKRMQGPALEAEQRDALARWIDRQPLLRVTPPDADAVARGKTLFESQETGCASCHSGERFTNNQNAFVGTRATVQVPSLSNVSFRAPFIHDGCASELTGRFEACGGGEKHGHTEQLSDDEAGDLAAFLMSL